MALRDEIRRERQALLKNGTAKEKIQYFIDYYGKISVCIILAIVLLFSFVYNIITKKENKLSGILLNVFSYETDYTPQTLADDFSKAIKLDTDEYEVGFNSSLTYSTATTNQEGQVSNYQTNQVIMAQAGAQALDFIAGPYAAIYDMAYGSLFADLSTILTKEQMQEYEEYFLYMDQDVVEQRDKLYDEMGDPSSIETPVSMDKEGMVKPIPVAIDMSHCSKLTDVYAYNVGEVSFAVIAGTPNTETIQQFIDYVMK